MTTKNLKYYLDYIEDIRDDLAITIRRKLWKYNHKIFQSLNVLIEILEDVATEAMRSTMLNQSEKEELQREVITLLKQFQNAREVLTQLAELQQALPQPLIPDYKNLNF
ncbi:hypothetical protein [Pantoea dispersa]